MTDVRYNIEELQKLKYTKIIFTGPDNTLHEIKTEVNFIRDDSISLYIRLATNININCPQKITIKFIADSGMYVAIATLQKVARVDNIIYFTISPPQTLYKQQNRKYYRVNLKRTCVLIATDKNGLNSIFMSRSVDVSAGGVLIENLESIFNSKQITIEPENYESFNIVLFLDLDVVLKMSARFVRQDMKDNSYRYAFEFIKVKQCDIDTISKYVAKEQYEQLNSQNK